MSRGRPRRRSRPSPLLRPDTARSPVLMPSLSAGEWLQPSRTALRGPRSAHNTTSCTGRSLHSHPGRCWASCWTQRDALRECEGTGSDEDAVLPADVIDESRLQQQVSAGQQVITDQVLIGANGHTVTHAQRTQDIQHLNVTDTPPSVRLRANHQLMLQAPNATMHDDLKYTLPHIQAPD